MQPRTPSPIRKDAPMENDLKYCIWIRTIQPVHVEIACA